MNHRLHHSQPGRVAFFQRNPRNRVIAEILRAHRYEVCFPTEEEVQGEIGLWIASLSNPSEASAATESRKSGRKRLLLAIAERYTPTVASLSRELDAHELVVLDGVRGLRDLVDAVDDALGFDSEDEVSRGSRSYRCNYEADEDGTNNSAYELAAFLAQMGVAHAHRIRIVSAFYEATDNVYRHAYAAGAGTFDIEVDLERTRVHISVFDQGCGFDAERVRLDYVPAALPTKVTEGNEPETISGGLDRLAALSEGYDVRSNDKGTHVEMRFELTPVQFEEEPDDVDGDDSFDPRYARELVRALQGGAEELGDIAPALTLTIGRLLGGSRRGH